MNPAKSNAWDAALFVLKTLRESGHTALLAGGCVRDRLLGREPKDYDIATDARPERVRQLFPKARLVGAQFGVVLVRKFGWNIEVATFRADGRYSDGRHPDGVTFGTDVDDANRRDFTINGLFLDPLTDRVIDHVGGRDDLARKVIRTIGDPERRFAEDHLRMLRAVRLSARLGFPIDPATADAIRRFAPQLRAMSPERIWMELEQVLTEPTRALGWTLLRELGLRAQLSENWPEDPLRDLLAGKRLDALPKCTVEAPLALAAVLVGFGRQETGAVCRSLRLSNRLTSRTRWLVESLPLLDDVEGMELADFKTLMVHDDWNRLVELLHADLAARESNAESLLQLRAKAASIAPSGVAPPPLLSGEDVAALGLAPGPQMGEILRALYRAQLNETITTRDDALAMFKSLMGRA